MKIIDRLIILSLSLSSMALAQLPFFLQRFRPVRHSLLGSGSSSYPSFASSLFPSSSLLSPTYTHSSLLGSSSFSSPFASSGLSSLSLSSPFAASASSLSPHFGSSFSSSSLANALLSSPSFASPSHFSRSPNFASYLSGSSGLGSSYLSGSSGLGSSYLSGSSGLGSSYLSGSSGLGSSYLSSSPSFGSSYLSNSPSLSLAHFSSPHKLSSSNSGHSLVDLGTSGHFDGIGGFDQAELVDDYQGFSNSGFGKDLNFAGSQAMKVQAPPHYSNGDLVYLQRTNEENKQQEQREQE